MKGKKMTARPEALLIFSPTNDRESEIINIQGGNVS